MTTQRPAALAEPGSFLERLKEGTKKPGSTAQTLKAPVRTFAVADAPPAADERIVLPARDLASWDEAAPATAAAAPAAAQLAGTPKAIAPAGTRLGEGAPMQSAAGVEALSDNELGEDLRNILDPGRAQRMRDPQERATSEFIDYLQRQAPRAAVSLSDAGTAPSPVATLADAGVSDDAAEYDLIKGEVTDASSDAFKDRQAYLDYRNAYFGSADDYRAYAADADAELDQDVGGKKKLRDLLEDDWSGDKRKVFYRWTRRAYQKIAGVKPADIPAYIARGSKPETVAALAKVTAAYKKPFKRDTTLVPRPMKTAAPYRLRLGTLSQHAMGNAVDVEAADNPNLSLTDWKFIEDTAGQHVDRDEPDIETLWTAIHDLNAAFVKMVSGQVDGGTPVATVFLTRPALAKYANGFFSLDKDLVKAFSNAGFVWGATWKSGPVDLMHFELP